MIVASAAVELRKYAIKRGAEFKQNAASFGHGGGCVLI